jgi:ferritin
MGMLDQRMQDALNGQINAELYSAYLYLSMSSQFAELGMAGGQNWMHVQFQEELFHVEKFFNYVVERGGRVLLTAIEKPDQEWPTPLAMFEQALQHEHKVTGLINALADLALELRDHATLQELQWFIGEQVEEEATADDMVKKLRLVQGAPGGLYEIDKELAARVCTPPLPAAK